jgi:hypothetical protein
MFQEFPKALYLAGDAQAAYVVVTDAAEERHARADGYTPIGEAPTPAGAAPKRTRGPNKAK